MKTKGFSIGTIAIVMIAATAVLMACSSPVDTDKRVFSGALFAGELNSELSIVQAGTADVTHSVSHAVSRNGIASLKTVWPGDADKTSGSLAIEAKGGRTFPDSNALTFWAKSPGAAQITDAQEMTVGLGHLGYGTLAANVKLTEDWKKYILPIPDTTKLKPMFSLMTITGVKGKEVVYFNDIKYEQIKEIKVTAVNGLDDKPLPGEKVDAALSIAYSADTKKAEASFFTGVAKVTATYVDESQKDVSQDVSVNGEIGNYITWEFTPADGDAITANDVTVSEKTDSYTPTGGKSEDRLKTFVTATKNGKGQLVGSIAGSVVATVHVDITGIPAKATPPAPLPAGSSIIYGDALQNNFALHVLGDGTAYEDGTKLVADDADELKHADWKHTGTSSVKLVVPPADSVSWGGSFFMIPIPGEGEDKGKVTTVDVSGYTHLTFAIDLADATTKDVTNIELNVAAHVGGADKESKHNLLDSGFKAKYAKEDEFTKATVYTIPLAELKDSTSAPIDSTKFKAIGFWNSKNDAGAFTSTTLYVDDIGFTKE